VEALSIARPVSAADQGHRDALVPRREESRHVRYFHAGSRLMVRPQTCADRPDLIIDRLNQAFLQVGSRLGLQAIVELSGLPTLTR
jgi:hypothetical protein